MNTTGYTQASNYRKIPLTYLHLIPDQVSYRTRKMEYTLLPDLAPHKIHAKIQVHVSRKWLFRGATDSGPLQHVDMVLSDREGNAIYAEIPGNLAEQKATNIEEGGVYDINRFRVCAAKTVFKIVDGDKMIQFTFHTIVKCATSPPTTFPLYVYRLTSFDLIEPHVQTTNNFVDVLGVITEIHELTPVHVRSQLTPTVTRTIIIEDLRWYFNPTIPEAEPYLTSQSTKRIVLQLPQNLQHPPAMETKPIVEHKSLYELLTVNPYDFPETGFECTITIAEIPAEHKWWFPSCTKCNKATIPHTTGYHCESCNWDGYKFKYKLKFLASDETDIAEMFCFDTVARHIVGKSLQTRVISIAQKKMMAIRKPHSLIQYPLTKEKDQQIQLNRHLKGSNKGRYASEKKWTSNPPRTKVSLRSSSTF
ncbi:hypothetical protein ZEAMMB73_Zm00001d025507 [Zea mays]|uniref:Replication factor A C-terminal domain-containing protein n=2 Tax=Zea mays TaxID=4577 RepID=A0A1D6J7G2_MAIZE|nr:hypothetical protein ZEAMMB73_Zm00001d025507 [Zea mays]